MTGFRWRIVALLFFATVINYIDRNVLSFTMIDDGFRKAMLGLPSEHVLSPEDVKQFKEVMGYVDFAFKITYAVGFLAIGYLIDRVGTKVGLAIGMLVWSFAAVLGGATWSARSMGFARGILGLGEASIFPSSVKAISEWFPKHERTLATGIFNAGTNIGVILTALSVPAMTLYFGWRASFLVTGALGFIMFLVWVWLYRAPEQATRISQMELDYIRSGSQVYSETSADALEQSHRVSWLQLLRYRQTWALMGAKFMADPVWWFYLTWLPSFFNDNTTFETKLDLKTIGIPFLVIYLVSDFGSIFFGWVSTQLMKQGWSMNAARKSTLLFCALSVVPIYFASTTSSMMVAVALIALATAAHQGWSANIYPIGSDLFPKHLVASISGIGGTAGAVGGIIMAPLAGIVISRYGYTPLFLWASSAYVIAWIYLNLVLPKMVPIDLGPYSGFMPRVE
jgi:MFS transporter, ACS family, hexuronate transporter